jgi:hypothetical protein
VLIQGATGFVSMTAVRDDAEQRAATFCRAKGDRRWEAIEETTANPPYILGNFPRIEIEVVLVRLGRNRCWDAAFDAIARQFHEPLEGTNTCVTAGARQSGLPH